MFDAVVNVSVSIFTYCCILGVSDFFTFKVFSTLHIMFEKYSSDFKIAVKQPQYAQF